MIDVPDGAFAGGTPSREELESVSANAIITWREALRKKSALSVREADE
jgi:hypothetical protein